MLFAVSTADRRRQNALGAAQHLVDCATCADLSVLLLQRRRGALLLLPLAVLFDRLRHTGRWIRAHPLHGAATGTGVVAAAVAAAVLAQPGTPSRPPAPTHIAPAPPPGILSSGRVNLFAAMKRQSPRAVLAAHADQPVRAQRVTVDQLAGTPEGGQPDDERFWIGDAPGRRVLVFLHVDAEPPTPIVVGQRYDFTGTVEALPANPEALGIQPTAAAEAAATGYYIDVTSLNDIRRVLPQAVTPAARSHASPLPASAAAHPDGAIAK